MTTETNPATPEVEAQTPAPAPDTAELQSENQLLQDALAGNLPSPNLSNEIALNPDFVNALGADNLNAQIVQAQQQAIRDGYSLDEANEAIRQQFTNDAQAYTHNEAVYRSELNLAYAGDTEAFQRDVNLLVNNLDDAQLDELEQTYPNGLNPSLVRTMVAQHIPNDSAPDGIAEGQSLDWEYRGKTYQISPEAQWFSMMDGDGNTHRVPVDPQNPELAAQMASERIPGKRETLMDNKEYRKLYMSITKGKF